MQAKVEIGGEVRTVEVAANGMTADKLSNYVVDRYTDAMGGNTDGVIGFGDGDEAVLLDRLSPTSPQTPLDSPEFAATFAQQTGGKVLAYAERVSVVPPRDRLLAMGMERARADLFMQGNHPAPAVSWNDGVGIWAWLSEMTGRKWGFPDEVEHQVAGLAGRNPREFPFPTRSGTEETLPYEAHYGQPWETGVTVANRNFAPTPWGHHDMAGNLWEWMQQHWTTGSSTRVVRAGAWVSNADCLRAGNRIYHHPDGRYHDFGLRGRVGP